MSDTEQLIAEQIPKLRRYARALLGDPIRADDLVQEALLRGLSRSHLWQPGTDIRAWMFTILHNIHINNQRQRRTRADYQELDDDQPEMATPPSQERSLEIRDLARALQLLPEPQRQVVLLVGLEGMNYKNVAAVLDIPIGTVMSRLHRGREALRRFMAYGPAPQGGRSRTPSCVTCHDHSPDLDRRGRLPGLRRRPAASRATPGGDGLSRRPPRRGGPHGRLPHAERGAASRL